MNPLPEQELKKLADALARVQERIAAAAHRAKREPREVTLVAVTKSATIEQIAGLVSLGQLDLGENRVQQLAARAAELAAVTQRPSAMPRWHMIGHLQRNKVKQVAPLVTLIHSVDSERLARELSDWSAARLEDLPAAPPVDVLLQVNIAEEEQKFGLTSADAPRLAAQVSSMPGLRLRGLMTMAPYSDHAEESRPVFAEASALFQALRSSLKSAHFDLLSMGMSGDYEVAIEEGANVVRVGRALFE